MVYTSHWDGLSPTCVETAGTQLRPLRRKNSLPQGRVNGTDSEGVLKELADVTNWIWKELLIALAK